MKTGLLLSLLFALQPAPAFAVTRARPGTPAPQGRRPPVARSPQTMSPASPGMNLQLGRVGVVLPAPEGFEEVASQFESVRTNMAATEDPGNEFLAAHLPAETAAALRRGERVSPDFYTKVSILRQFKDRDVTEAELRQMASLFSARAGQLFDPDGTLMKERVRQLEDALTGLSGTQTDVGFGQPEMLGVLEDAPGVFSMMMRISISYKAGETAKVVPLLATMSMVRVRSRLLYVYVYKRFESRADVNLLRDFTRKWTASIAAANRARANA